MRDKITLIKGDKVSSGSDFLEADYRDALLVNMYAVNRNILGAQGYILDYPGLTEFGVGSGIDRASNYNERFNLHFRVSGTKFISVDSSGTVTELGDVPGTKQLRMPYSFNTQAIIGEGKMFLYDPVNGFREVTDPDLGNVIDGDWINGYYFLTDGENVYHTDITNESAIDPLKFATSEFAPDPTLGISKTQDNLIIVWNRYSIEYFEDRSTTNFAFRRLESRAQKIGIVATHAKVEEGGIFYIVGGSKNDSVSVYTVGLGSTAKIASREIDKIISKYSESEMSDIRLESRTENNVTFILVHLPEETLCYNATTGGIFGSESGWSILKTDVLGDNTYRAINGSFDPRISKWIYGDKIDSRLGVLDNDVRTHYGEIVESIFYTPVVNMERMSVDEIEIETIPGHHISEDATVAMSLTYDGINYTSEYWNLYSTPYDYGKRFILRELGYVDSNLGFKFRTASTARMAFSLMSLEYN